LCKIVVQWDMAIPKHPGAILKEKLEASGWTQDELAAITGKTRSLITKIIAGQTNISTEMAVVLAAAFGDSPEEWVLWGSQYELSLIDAPVEEITKRARFYADLPIRDMQKRGWLSLTTDTASLEAELDRLFGQPTMKIAARKSDPFSELLPKEKAWALRARQLAATLLVEPYNEVRLPQLIKKLRILAAYPEEVTKLSAVLAGYGIRFLIVEPLTGSTLDGATFWMDDIPVIAMTARFDRNDNFWFTFFHELGHVFANDASSFDSFGSQTEVGFQIGEASAEAAADRFAADTLVPTNELTSFIARVAPLYQETRIVQFSIRMKMHPGIILGQLHKRGEVSYGAHRKLISKIRDSATRTALTDGWGHSISPKLLSGDQVAI
jgi:HTH-type transcriptional regulator/antitoxin HigA